jgi:hypothetical protein
MCTLFLLLPNGERYPRGGGTRQRHFAGTNFKPRKLPENAATPTRRVHAVLGGMDRTDFDVPTCLRHPDCRCQDWCGTEKISILLL